LQPLKIPPPQSATRGEFSPPPTFLSVQSVQVCLQLTK